MQRVEITILSVQGVTSALLELAPGFERATGHRVIISSETVPSFTRKIDADVPADLVAHSPEVVDDLMRRGRVLPGSRVDFARAGIGVAVRVGTSRPDIGTTEAFRRAMLDAKSIAYSKSGFSGLYAAQVMERLGIADEIRAKTIVVDGVPVAELVAKGEADIGLQQINVILPIPGADYAGPLPPELQSYLPFSLGVVATTKAPDVAAAFAAFAAAPENEALIRKGGMEPAAR